MGMSPPSVQRLLPAAALAFLHDAYLEMRHARSAADCSMTVTAWNDGFFRGALDAAAVVAGVSPEAVFELVVRRANPGAYVDAEGILRLP